MKKRQATIKRDTKETQITLKLEPDNDNKENQISTGIGFFDHMLTLFAFHGNFFIDLEVSGDLQTDAHHTIEDTGIVLGQALLKSLGDKKGIRRYASGYLPMDETLCRTALDISGRAYHVFQCDFSGEFIGAFPTEMVKHFFQSFVQHAGITLHQQILYGENDHHKAEALFKGFGRCLREAVMVDSSGKIQSTKGLL